MNALKNKLNLTVNQTRFWVSNPKAKLRSQFSTGDEAVDMVTFLLQVMAILVHRWHWWNCCCYKTLFWSNFSVNFFAVNLVIRLSCYVAVLLLNKFSCFSLSFNRTGLSQSHIRDIVVPHRARIGKINKVLSASYSPTVGSNWSHLCSKHCSSSPQKTGFSKSIKSSVSNIIYRVRN